jgi:hypothetical protein
MKFVSIPYNDFIYEIFIYEMLCEIFVRGPTTNSKAHVGRTRLYE